MDSPSQWTDAPVRAVVAVGAHGAHVLWSTGCEPLHDWCRDVGGQVVEVGLGDLPRSSAGELAQGVWLWCSSAALPEPVAGTPQFSAWMDCSFHEPHWSRPSIAQLDAISTGHWEKL